MIAVFYHVYQGEGWEQMFREQRDLLIDSGLAAQADFVHIGVNGDKEIDDQNIADNIVHNKNLRMEESDTLKSLKNFAEKQDTKILYMHTKGISRPHSEEMKDWRKMMEYFCIERWEDCIAILDKYDACGVNYMYECYYGTFPHFSGNFWWANSEHIRKLNDSYLNHPSRFYREFWIGSTLDFNFYELHHSGYEYHGHHRYPPERYRDDV